jgi:hypothetical protein
MAENQNITEDKTLNRLVSQLTLEERHDFLEKLRGQSTLSFEPLYESEEADEKLENFEEQYSRLPWHLRLYYFIVGLLKSKPPAKVFEDRRIGRLGREIAAAAPGLYDYQRNLLLADFHRHLSKLKEAARFFFTALDASVNRDKGAFYAFLGSLEMEDIHRRLQADASPATIAEQFPDMTETELRQFVLKAMDDAFAAISDTHRTAMYYNARSLNCLKELAAFLFDRVLMAFSTKPGGQTCQAGAIRTMLIELNNILFSLKEPPGLSLLESLFIFLLQERSEEQGFDMSREMRTLLSRAEIAITIIRDFNRRIPLLKILRCAGRDMSLSPKQISGGEDWFQVYREHWKRQIDGAVAEFIQQRKYRQIVNSFKSFLKGANLKILSNAVSENSRDGIPVPEAFTLSFLRTFYSAVFMTGLNDFLRPILIEGEFFKKENRSEFTGAYNDIMNIEIDVAALDASLAPSGDYGKRYFQAKQDLAPLPLKRRKMQIVLDEVSHEASGLVIRSRNALVALINVLTGLLRRETGSKYDSLANFEQFAGKNPEVFIEAAGETIKQLQQALQTLKDIDAIVSQ